MAACSWPTPEFLIMGYGELLPYPLLKLLSQQLVLQGPTEAESFSLGEPVSVLTALL